jgi:hypothetical protein
MSNEGPRHAARGSASQAGLQNLTPIERASERKRANLEWLLSLADTLAEKNRAKAESAFCEEIGMFDDKPENWQALSGLFEFKFAGEEFTAEKRDAFIERTRVDVLTTNLNSVSLLAEIQALKASQIKFQKEMWVAVILLIIGVCYLIFRNPYL